jgi:hypothetical protein
MQGSREPATTEVVPQADNRRLVLELAGAAAGIVIFVSLVGGVVISARLRSLGLPIDSTLAVLPRESVLIAGVRALSGGLLAALVVISVLWVLDRSGVSLRRDDAPRRPSLREAGVLALAVVPLLVITLDYGVTTTMAIVSVAAAGVAAAVALLILRRSRSFGQLSVRLLVVVAALGGVLAFARVYDQPIALDFATVQLKDGGRTNGFLLGQSSAAIVLAPDVLKRTIGRTVAIPRDEVVNLQLSRVTAKVRPIGPNPVSRFTVDVSRVNARVREREHDLQQRLLRIRLSAQWKYPPLIFAESVQAWRRAFDQFGRGAKVPAGERAQRAQRATLEDLNEHTPLFAGQLVLTAGHVLEATPWKRNMPQRIVLRDRKEERYLATCDIWRPRQSPLRPRQEIRLRGLVLASGIFVSGAGAERNRVAMVCSSARALRARRRPA